MTHTLPAGTWSLVDPGTLIDEQQWDDFVDKVYEDVDPSLTPESFVDTHEGQWFVVAVPTAGPYTAEGVDVTTDSGLLALVPDDQGSIHTEDGDPVFLTIYGLAVGDTQIHAPEE